MTLALIDGDIVAYRAAIGHQKDINWGDCKSSDVDPIAAAEAALQTIDAWMRLSRCSDCIVAFTGRENFRKRVLPTYKAHRAGKVKPLAYLYTVDAVRARFRTETIEGLEADDVLGILATTETYSDAIILTVDKDLRTIPARHFNPLKDTKPVLRSEYAADAQWLMQALTGDPSDGYTGIPGIGPKKAEKLLGGDIRQLAAQRCGPRTLWSRVLAAYHAAKLTEDDALVQARVARILRRCDYDKATKEVLLWHPTTPVRIPLLLSPSDIRASNAPTAGEGTASPPPAPPVGTSTSRKEAE